MVRVLVFWDVTLCKGQCNILLRFEGASVCAQLPDIRRNISEDQNPQPAVRLFTPESSTRNALFSGQPQIKWHSYSHSIFKEGIFGWLWKFMHKVCNNLSTRQRIFQSFQTQFYRLYPAACKTRRLRSVSFIDVLNTAPVTGCCWECRGFLCDKAAVLGASTTGRPCTKTILKAVSKYSLHSYVPRYVARLCTSPNILLGCDSKPAAVSHRQQRFGLCSVWYICSFSHKPQQWTTGTQKPRVPAITAYAQCDILKWPNLEKHALLSQRLCQKLRCCSI
jgi:hypothetical protein